eukprot:CAMPEP_0114529028 /NCGR_PEP_ID=MMETSP0109-20121206/24586_1 /TAXON_ID=29199 /ORGANISM="Chlorarachnion reptans, Strain CCCM449" /LENGTH=197 /DNA_ID=CAMNT_0001711343 /DNA_START=53 /DNA_END=643 /DNA_ORIENTATION=+
MTDYLVGTLAYPFVWAYDTSVLVTALVLAAVPTTLRVVTKGSKSLSKLEDMFEFFEGLPLGKVVVASLIGFTAPYSASISASIEYLKGTKVRASIYDRPWLRNPFSSIHAVALANLGELATGVAMMSCMQSLKNIRGIPVELNMVYKKKARGKITCESDVQPALEALQKMDDKIEVKATGNLYNEAKEVVAICTVKW